MRAIHTSSPTLNRLLATAHSGYCVIAVLVFCVICYFFIDQRLAWHTLALPHRLINLGNHVTKLGMGWIYFIVLPILALIAKFILKKDLWCRKIVFLFCAILASSLLCNVIKVSVGRARPIMLYSKKIYGFGFFHSEAFYHSFPSGHSTLITALMLGLALLLPRYWFIFFIIAVLVCASRLVVSAHYLSDVMAGFYLSIWVVPWIYQRFPFNYVIQSNNASAPT